MSSDPVSLSGAVLDGGEDMHGAETRKLPSCQDAGCKPAKLQCGIIKHKMGMQARGERGPRGTFEPEKMYEGKAASREAIPASHFFQLHRMTEAVTLTFPNQAVSLRLPHYTAQGQHTLGRLLQAFGNGLSCEVPLRILCQFFLNK